MLQFPVRAASALADETTGFPDSDCRDEVMDSVCHVHSKQMKRNYIHISTLITGENKNLMAIINITFHKEYPKHPLISPVIQYHSISGVRIQAG